MHDSMDAKVTIARLIDLCERTKTCLPAGETGRSCYAPSVEDKNSNMNFLHVGKPFIWCFSFIFFICSPAPFTAFYPWSTSRHLGTFKMSLDLGNCMNLHRHCRLGSCKFVMPCRYHGRCEGNASLWYQGTNRNLF